MTISDLKRMTEEDARELIESVIWKDGCVCPKCGNCDQERIVRIEANKAKRIREGLRRCKECRGTFTVTNNSIMEGSHLPMRTWVYIIASMCTAKKGISSRQLQRELKDMHPNGGYGNIRNIWHACHRVRLAMSEDGITELLGGEGKIVEMDESVFAGAPRSVNNGKTTIVRDKTVVVTLTERGGRSRSGVIRDTTAASLGEYLNKYADKRSRLMTDNAKGYIVPGRAFVSHETTSHTTKEYARGDVHSNTAEGWFSAAKLSFRAIHHGYSPEHAFRYLAERDLMWSTKTMSDVERVKLTISKAVGKRLFYKAPKAAQRPQGGQHLVTSADPSNAQQVPQA